MNDLEKATPDVGPPLTDSYYADVKVGDVAGSLTLSNDLLIFSPLEGEKKSWKISSMEGKEVEDEGISVSLTFEAGQRIVVNLSIQNELERLNQDIDSRKVAGLLKDAEEEEENEVQFDYPNATKDEEDIVPPTLLTQDDPEGREEARLLPGASSRMKRHPKSRRVVREHTLAGVVVKSMHNINMDDSGKSHGETTTGEMITALTEDIYSLMFTAKFCGRAFWFALLSFATQASILILLFLDLVDVSENPPQSSNGRQNRLNIPVGVDITVTIAQFIGMFLCITFLLDQGDLFRGFEHLCNGYDKNVIMEAPHATFPKWLLAGVLQSLVGMVMTADLFILLMQSSDVLSFCLNFAALHFVQELDDVAFAVASMGLFSRKIQEECLAVGRVMISEKAKTRTLWMRRLLLLVLFVGLYTGFFVVWGWQASGEYRCESMYVQFGDAFAPELSYYSGRFVSEGNSWSGRPSFLHETGELKMEYSSSDKAWVIKWASELDLPEDERYREHIVGSHLVKSSETDTYDVTTVADQPWYAHMQAGEIPMDWIAITCADCSTDRCWPEHGTCVDNVCECNDHHMGLNCEIHAPHCEFYALDYRTKAGLEDFRGGSFFLESEYTNNLNFTAADERWEDITIFDRPLYFHTGSKSILVFSGRRWIMLGPEENIEEMENDPCFCIFNEFNITKDMTSLKALKTLQNETDFIPLYFSSPMDYGTPSQGVDFRSLTWFVAMKDEPEEDEDTPEVILGYKSSIFGYVPDAEYPITAKFLCSECHADKGCHNQGLCYVRDGVGSCDCQALYTGYMCEQVKSCHSIGCFNGGECDDITGTCTDCMVGASGNLCQYPNPPDLDFFYCTTRAQDLFLDEWGWTWPYDGKCANNQKCNPFEQRCECESPFFGDACINSTQATCQTVEEFYNNWTDPCENDGYCEDSIYLSHPICVCQAGFSGDFCEETDTENGFHFNMTWPSFGDDEEEEGKAVLPLNNSSAALTTLKRAPNEKGKRKRLPPHRQ